MLFRKCPCSYDGPAVLNQRSQKTGLIVLALAWVLVATAILARADGPTHPGLYVPPVNSFILNPGETPVALNFGWARLSDIQSQLDAARAANPESPIVLTLTGAYRVTNAPLSLPSNTSLVLYGKIKAARNATAPSLIAITGQSKVAIAGGLLEGSNANLVGIDVESSAKVNIDAVTIADTRQDGIILSGNGNTVFDSGSAITRCDVSHSGGNGITVRGITQALVLDSFVHDNAGAGIEIGSAHTSVVNNVSHGNEIGILVDTNDNLISDNELRGNRHAGLQLAASSANTAVLRNVVTHNGGTGIDLDGANNLVYANTVSQLIDHSSTNWVVPQGSSIIAPVSQYFFPPTIDNPHADAIMNGRNRTDINVGPGTIVSVQQAYNAARLLAPNDVIVLHMNGDFTLDGTPLTLSSNTAVLLAGTIHITSTTTAPTAITTTNPASFVSISGGTIDCAGRTMEAISFPSATMANVDGVTIINEGTRDKRTGGGVIHLSRGSGYNLLRRNTINQSGGRCIWTQNANSRYVVLENQLSNCNMDAVDFDSSTSNSFAIGNSSVDNLRYGVFVEQSDSLNKVYGNFSTDKDIASPPGHGVGVYNNATSSGTRGVTNGNTVFSNIADTVSNAFRVGSISTATGGIAESAHSYFFNNIARNNRSNGILVDTAFPRSVQNYFSQTVFSGNKTDIVSHPTDGAEDAEYFNPKSALNLALNQPVTASSTAAGSDPANAVDGLAFTNWIAGREAEEHKGRDRGWHERESRHHEPRAWLSVDLGSSVSFRRVVLKPVSGRAIREIELEISDDGVNFSDIKNTSHRFERVQTFTFNPVTARFLRVRIEQREDDQVGLEEVGVYPE